MVQLDQFHLALDNALFIRLPLHDQLCEKSRYWQDDILQGVTSENNHVLATTLPFIKKDPLSFKTIGTLSLNLPCHGMAQQRFLSLQLFPVSVKHCLRAE